MYNICVAGLLVEKTEFHRNPNPKYWRVKETDLDLYQAVGGKYKVTFTPITGPELERIYPSALRPSGYSIVKVKGSKKHLGDIFKEVTKASLEREKSSTEVFMHDR